MEDTLMRQTTDFRLADRVKEESRSALDEVLREGARRMLQSAIDVEVFQYVHTHEDLVDGCGRRQVVRNGHMPARELVTGVGPIEIRQPRVHDRRPEEKFTSCILPPYLRRTPSIDALIPFLYLKGISTGDFSEALTALLGEKAAGLSATNIVRLKKIWEQDYQEWNSRSLVGKRYVYLWADGIVRHEAPLDRAGCKSPPSACRSRPMKRGAA